MIKILDYINNKWVHISLQEMCNKYDKEVPNGWYQYIEEMIDRPMMIKNEEEYQHYLKQYNLKEFDYKELKKFYEVLKKTKYAQMFDEDILKFIAFIKVMDFFTMIKYPLDKDTPNLDEWLNTKCPFCSEDAKAKFKEDEMFSISDLLPLQYGMNAIRSQMLRANKWIF